MNPQTSTARHNTVSFPRPHILVRTMTPVRRGPAVSNLGKASQ